MEQNPSVTAAFAVDVDKLHGMGMVDPYSPQSLEIYRSGTLTSNERLYFSLWGAQDLNSTLITPRNRLCVAGDPADKAYFIVTGNALGVDGDKRIFRLGPGSVIGMAESLGGLPYAMTVVSVTSLQVKVFHLHKIAKLLPRMPVGLRGVLRSAVMRTLALKSPPETLR